MSTMNFWWEGRHRTGGHLPADHGLLQSVSALRNRARIVSSWTCGQYGNLDDFANDALAALWFGMFFDAAGLEFVGLGANWVLW